MTPCILSKRRQAKNGYPVLLKWKGVSMSEHRKVYLIHNHLDVDALPGLVIRHTCDNRMCVNPGHLIVGTFQQNSWDAVERKRITTQKLCVDEVKEILWCFESGVRIKTLAFLYGVGRHAIMDIVHKRSWKFLRS